jgi:hypothetical protein
MILGRKKDAKANRPRGKYHAEWRVSSGLSWMKYLGQVARRRRASLMESKADMPNIPANMTIDNWLQRRAGKRTMRAESVQPTIAA